MLDCVDPCRGFWIFPSVGVFFNLRAKIGTQAAADPVPISFTYSPESFAYRVKILQKKAWNYQKNPYCYSMFKINDIVTDKAGNVFQVIDPTYRNDKFGKQILCRKYRSQRRSLFMPWQIKKHPFFQEKG